MAILTPFLSLQEKNNMNFQLENKIWGTARATLSPKSLSALRLKYCLEDLKKIKEGRVLEVGCGAGMFALAIKRNCPSLEVWGCDINKKAIAKAQTRTKKVKFFVGDVYRLPVEDESCEAVVAFDLFEHLERPEKAFSEVRRVLKKGGIFHLFVPCEGEIYTIHGLFNKLGFFPKREYAGHIQQFTIRRLNNLFRQNGFKVKRVRFSSHYFYQIVDFTYFLVLRLFRRNIGMTVEGYLEEKRSESIKWRFLNFVKEIIAGLIYFESLLLARVPGHGVHFSSVKVGNKR